MKTLKMRNFTKMDRMEYLDAEYLSEIQPPRICNYGALVVIHSAGYLELMLAKHGDEMDYEYYDDYQLVVPDDEYLSNVADKVLSEIVGMTHKQMKLYLDARF